MQKRIKLICLLTLLSIGIAFGQTGGKIIKVSYESTPLSPSVLSIMKKQLPDPEQLKSLINVLQKHKGYYSLYIDNKTHESLFVLDSLHSEPGVSSPGQIEFLYTSPDGEILGEESFMKSTIILKDKLSNIKWDIADETKLVYDYKCRNATIENSPNISVWFSPEISTNRGPGYFQGLLGLVFEANDFLSTTYVTEIKNIEQSQFIRELFEKYQQTPSGKTYSLEEFFLLKQNFIKTLKTE
ncbi:MAG: GLPGLI family protein [Tannerellaceae bacterium]|jgi:GLPGLI family protein|nr:GLPGLI family protein [Tannerellaceae bacterium]